MDDDLIYSVPADVIKDSSRRHSLITGRREGGIPGGEYVM